MNQLRYEIIAWDGFAKWGVVEYHTRKEARESKRTMIKYYGTSKIWDRKRKEFVR